MPNNRQVNKMPEFATQPMASSPATIPASHQPLLAHLTQILPALIRDHSLHQQQGLTSLSLRIPDKLINTSSLYSDATFFYARGAEGLQQFGLGECISLHTSGPGRFHAANRFFQQHQPQWQWFDPDQTGVEPRAFCAFSYSGQPHQPPLWAAFPNTLVHIPRVFIERQKHQAIITFNTHLQQSIGSGQLLALWLAAFQPRQPSPPQRLQQTPHPAADGATSAIDDQQHSHWHQSVNQALHSIREKHLDKLVLTRMASHRLRRPVQVAPLAVSLQQRFPNCAVFSARFAGDRFICATPERLLRLHHGHLDCDAIGGTIGRGADATRDRHLAAHILADPKARHEHRLVVEAIGKALGSYCEHLHIPGTPRLLRLPNLQHLWTPIQARIRTGTTLFQLATAIHPTPAVGGFPASAAADWLARHETTCRGWYTGAAGWVDRQGQGELSVLLRAALLTPNSAHLFAGAGIVADSVAELEWQETEMKLAAMREALGIPDCLSQGGCHAAAGE